jgi:hypothetical protein
MIGSAGSLATVDPPEIPESGEPYSQTLPLNSHCRFQDSRGEVIEKALQLALSARAERFFRPISR